MRRPADPRRSPHCDVAAHVDRRFAIRRIGDAARRAHVVLRDRADDVVERKSGGDEQLGSTATSIAGVTEPPTLTFEMPSTCSSSGTMLLVTIAESAPGESEREVTPSVRIVAWRDRRCRRSAPAVAGKLRPRDEHAALHLDEIGRLVRIEREDGRDRRLALLDGGVDVVEIRRAGDRVFDRPHDRVANLRRRTARIARAHGDRRKVDVRKLLLHDRHQRDRARHADERQADEDERRPENEEPGRPHTIAS